MAKGRLKTTLRAATERRSHSAAPSSPFIDACSGAFGVHGSIAAGHGASAFGRYTETAQRVFRHAARQLTLAHDDAIGAELFEGLELGGIVRADHHVDGGVQLPRQFNDASRLVAV